MLWELHCFESCNISKVATLQKLHSFQSFNPWKLHFVKNCIFRVASLHACFRCKSKEQRGPRVRFLPEVADSESLSLIDLISILKRHGMIRLPLSASEFAPSFASRSSRGSDCAQRNQGCGYPAVSASSRSCEAARPCWLRSRKSPLRPSSRFLRHRRTVCHWHPSSRYCHRSWVDVPDSRGYLWWLHGDHWQP